MYSSEAENIEPTTPDTLDSSSNILCENLLLATSSTDLQNNQECFQSWYVLIFEKSFECLKIILFCNIFISLQPKHL